MPHLSVDSRLYPYRLSLRDKQPMDVAVAIANHDSADKLVSLDLQLPDEVAFDKSGLNRRVSKRRDSL